jgi:hypothetical protein
VDGLADADDVAPVDVGDAQTERGFAVVAHGRGRRVGVPSSHRREVAEADGAPVASAKQQVRELVHRRKVARRGDADVLRPHLDGARARDDVLRLEGVEDLLRADSELRHAGTVDLDVDGLALNARDFHVRDPFDKQQFAPEEVGVVLEFAEGVAVAREGVVDAEDVAVVVVDAGRPRAGGEGGLGVRDLAAQLVPDLREVGSGEGVLDVHVDHREPLLRE